MEPKIIIEITFADPSLKFDFAEPNKLCHYLEYGKCKLIYEKPGVKKKCPFLHEDGFDPKARDICKHWKFV